MSLMLIIRSQANLHDLPLLVLKDQKIAGHVARFVLFEGQELDVLL